MTRFLEVEAELAAGVVQGLVERAAGRPLPLREHVDRDLVQGERNEDRPLARCQRLCDAGPDRAEQLVLLSRLPGSASGAREHTPCRVLDGHLPTLPRTSAYLDRGLVERELV